VSQDEEERTEVNEVVKVKEELKFFTYLVENQENGLSVTSDLTSI